MTIRSARDLVAEAAGQIRTIPADEAARLIGSPDAVLVDIREASELHKTGTVTGAVAIPRGLLEFQADPASPSHRRELDPARRIVLFCASGGRSTLAALTLKSMGFADVASVAGGFQAQAEAGAPVSRD